MASGVGPLVGRQRELGYLKRIRVAAARGNATQVAEVVGESGIGKSRLLGEFGAAAARDGWTVLTGHASESDRSNRIAVFADVLGDHFASLDLVEAWRLRLGIRALLEQLAPGRGLVLMLDDLHWGDDASLELLGHLVCHPPRRPLVLAVAYRPSLAPGRLTAMLAQAARQGRTNRVELGPLDA